MSGTLPPLPRRFDKLVILEASSAVSRARSRHPDACVDPSDVLEKEFFREASLAASPRWGAPSTGHILGGHRQIVSGRSRPGLG